MWTVSTSGLCVGWLCLSLATPALADQLQANQDDGALRLDEALVQTLEHNPTLIAAGYQITIEEANALQAGLAPNPELSVLVENAGGTGSFSGIDRTETTVSIGWVLERGKRTQRLATAQAGVSLAETERDVSRLDVAAQTARLFLEVLSLETQSDQALEAIALAESTLETVTKRVEAGRSPRAEQARAEADLEKARLVREDLEHRRLVAIRHLAAQWGEESPTFATVSGDLSQLPDPGSYESLASRLEDSPDSQRFLSEQRLREREIELAQIDARPNWRISAGVRRFEFSDDHAVVAELTIPLALRNKNQGRIARARSQLSLSEVRQSESLLARKTALFEIYQELVHSRHVASTFSDAVLPRLEEALKDTERAYAAGRYSIYELTAARTELLSARTTAVEAAVEYLTQIIEIERLTGLSLTPSLARSGGTP